MSISEDEKKDDDEFIMVSEDDDDKFIMVSEDEKEEKDEKDEEKDNFIIVPKNDDYLDDVIQSPIYKKLIDEFRKKFLQGMKNTPVTQRMAEYNCLTIATWYAFALHEKYREYFVDRVIRVIVKSDIHNDLYIMKHFLNLDESRYFSPLIGKTDYTKGWWLFLLKHIFHEYGFRRLTQAPNTDETVIKFLNVHPTYFDINKVYKLYTNKNKKNILCSISMYCHEYLELDNVHKEIICSLINNCPSVLSYPRMDKSFGHLFNITSCKDNDIFTFYDTNGIGINNSNSLVTNLIYENYRQENSMIDLINSLPEGRICNITIYFFIEDFLDIYIKYRPTLNI